MSGINNLAVKPATEVTKTDPFEESNFNLLAEELILQLFKNVPKQDFASLRVVCSPFKRIADDHSLLKDEINSITDTIGKLNQVREDKEDIDSEIKEIVETPQGAELKLFKLLGIFKKLLRELPKNDLAQLAPDGNLMENAPLFARHFKKQYKECWSLHLEQELSTRYNTICVNHNFVPELFPLFLEAVNSIGGEYALELDFTISVDQARLVAQALETGALGSKEISIVGSPDVDTEILNIYLTGIGQSNHVKKLKILSCELYANEFNIIDNALKNNASLESLSINDFAFSLESLETFSKMLTEHPEITTLELSRCSGAEMFGLLEKINQTNMQELAFRCSDLPCGSTDRLAEILPKLEKVRVLDLQHNKLSNEDIDFLQRIVEQGRLQVELKLPQKKIDLTQLRIMGLLR